MKKVYIVRLTEEERCQLQEVIAKGRSAAHRIKHANILLKVDANGEAWSDEQTAMAFECHANTVRNVRQHCVEQGLEAALERKKLEHPPRKPILDGDAEAHLLAIACGKVPEGRAKWTMQLLADKMVALNIVPTISRETVRCCLKKTKSSHICAKLG